MKRRSPARVVVTVIAIACTAGCATTRHPAPPQADGACPTGITHTVRNGETVFSIARLYNIDVNDLARRNRLAPSGAVTPGQILLIQERTPAPDARPAAPVGHRTVSVFAWPVTGTVIAPFGEHAGKRRNKGIDIAARQGTPVGASMNGTVVYCDPAMKGFGKTVIIDHGDNYQTVYAYADDILVKTGDTVRQHEPVAVVGMTGRATQPSLHFEIRKNGEPIDPRCCLP